MGYDEQHGHNPEQFQVGISFLLYISLIISNLNWGGNLEPLSDKDLFISPAKLRKSGETYQSPALNHPINIPVYIPLKNKPMPDVKINFM